MTKPTTCSFLLLAGGPAGPDGEPQAIRTHARLAGLRLGSLLSVLAIPLASACDKETDVGAACTMQPPCSEGSCGFGPTETYVDRSSGQCEQACIVHHLDNGTLGSLPANPTVVCDATGKPSGCVTKAQLDDAMYCSCRCNAAKGEEGFCECPDGFACTEVLSGVPAKDASYCVRIHGS